MSSSGGGGGSPKEGLLSVFTHLQWEQLAAGVSGGGGVYPRAAPSRPRQVNEGVGVAKRPQYTGLAHAFKSIVRQQGVRGLYQGVTPNVWGAGASWGLYFLWYNALKSRSRNGDADVQLNAGQNMLCAAQAGLLTLVLTNPLWVAKVRMCLQYDQQTTHYRGMVDCLRQTYRGEGMRGLYKGFLPGVFGTSHGALQFMAYEGLKTRYNVYRDQPPNAKFGTLEYLSFAALSKIFAASATYPYQVVRARLQDQHRAWAGARDVIRQTFRLEGVRGFYKGMVPGVLRVLPACCITFVVYEKTVELLLRQSSLRAEGRSGGVS